MDGAREPFHGRQESWPDRLLVSRPEQARPPQPPPQSPQPAYSPRPVPRNPLPVPQSAPVPAHQQGHQEPHEDGEGRDDHEGARGDQGEFVPDVTGRPVWRLLLRGLSVYLPGWRQPDGALRVPASAAARSSYGFGPPAFLNGDAGFGLHLPERRRGLEPDREIYVRGRDDPSFGIVIAGPAAAIGTRVVDGEELLRFARRLTFEELYEPADADSVPYAVRAARAVHNVVFLDRAAGVGLCAEVDQETRAALCPVFVRLGAPAERTVRAYGVAAQPVRSHS
ncbi:hypothetical protein GCM10010191_91040 [Actinomadura vinacea]|uniref:RES domain-containing protein n=1 Tax=Actinomadura vinacea TaxID=115336 RepID=A0ABP5XIQ8_9ACTN